MPSGIRVCAVCLATASAMAVAPALAQSAPTPDAAVAAAFAPPAAKSPAYAYDFLSERFGEDAGIIRGRFDPSKPKGQRYTIFEATAKDANLKKIDERYEKRGGGDIWCDEAFGGADGPVTQASDASGRSTYSFRPLQPRQSPWGDAKDLYRAMKADVVLDPASNGVLSYQTRLTKSVSMMVVATVKAAQISGQCAAAPNGRMYAARTEMNVDASGMGQKMQMRVVQTISNLTPVG